MGRSITTLTVILVLVLCLTRLILKNPVQDKPEEAPLQYSTTLSLSPYRYSEAIGNSSDEKPEYTIDNFLNRGYEYQREGDSKKAEDIFKTALLFDADNPEIMKAVGEMAFVDGRFHEACNYFAQYLTRRPGRVEAYTNLAIAFICAENLEAAKTTADQGLTRLGEAAPGPFYFIKACIEQKSGDIEKADEYLRKAYDELGPEIFNLVDSQWSASIRELAFYEQIAPPVIMDAAEPGPNTAPSPASRTVK